MKTILKSLAIIAATLIVTFTCGGGRKNSDSVVSVGSNDSSDSVSSYTAVEKNNNIEIPAN